MSEEKKVEQDERWAFEAHIRDKCESEEYAFLCLQRNNVGLYPTAWVQSEWEGWQARAASTSANVAQNDKQPLTDHRIWEIADLVWRRKSITTDRAFELDFAHEVIAAALHEARATSPANVAQGAEAVGLVMTNDKGEKYGALLDSNIEERTKLYSAPPAQTSLTEDARDAARWRWFTQNYGALNLHEKFAGNTPRVFTHGLKGRSWGEITRTIDAALTAAQSGVKS